MKKNNNHGGARKGAGRPTKVDEEKANQIFLKAIKQVFNKENDTDNKIAFAVKLLESQRGEMFIAEHIFGKPKEVVENINKNYDAGVLTEEEVQMLNKVIEEKY